MEIDVKNYIEHNIPELKDRLFPIMGTDISSLYIAYKFTDLIGGYVGQKQLELKIIWSDYDETQRIKQLLNTILDMPKDKPYMRYGNTYFMSNLSAGGGCLYNDAIQMYENTTFFIIKYRRI